MSEKTCALCGAQDDVEIITVEGAPAGMSGEVAVCQRCQAEQEKTPLDSHYWRCLNESAWSQEPAVQVLAWRLLQRLAEQGEGWAQDLRDMLYLDDAVKTWAEAESERVEQRDAHGQVLQAGDTVMLIKDLEVKGAGFTAKRGTTVRNIRLTDDPRFIEGKINGTTIVIVAEYVKKA